MQIPISDFVFFCLLFLSIGFLAGLDVARRALQSGHSGQSGPNSSDKPQ